MLAGLALPEFSDAEGALAPEFRAAARGSLQKIASRTDSDKSRRIFVGRPEREGNGERRRNIRIGGQPDAETDDLVVTMTSSRVRSILA